MDKKIKRTKVEKEKFVHDIGDDYEPDGKFGHDPKFIAVRKATIKLKNSDLRTIRIDDEFLADIKKAAIDEGFDSYQTFVKVTLKRYIMEKKRKQEA